MGDIGYTRKSLVSLMFDAKRGMSAHKYYVVEHQYTIHMMDCYLIILAEPIEAGRWQINDS